MTPDTYSAEAATHRGYGMPRGPVGTIPETAPTTAIGFCPMCATNARKTCSTRGAFDCPECMFVWYDGRVGEQTRSLEDFVSPVSGENDLSNRAREGQE